MSKTPNIITLDIGGTKINIGLINRFGKILKSKKLLTPKNLTVDKFNLGIYQLINNFKNDQTTKIGIALAGQISWPDGLIINSPNLKFLKKTNLKKYLESKFKLPVFIDNDAHCFTLAEALMGVGKKFNTVIGLTLGTGVGGGIVINQKIIRGANNTVGEFGHMKLTSDNLICACGLCGHLESYVSGPGMIKIFKQLTGQKLSTALIEKKFYQKNPAARQTLEIMAKYLGMGLANITNNYNPDIIVLGGGLIRVRPIWQKAIKIYFPKYVFYPQLKKTKIVTSKSGDNNILLGAALITTNNY